MSAEPEETPAPAPPSEPEVEEEEEGPSEPQPPQKQLPDPPGKVLVSKGKKRLGRKKYTAMALRSGDLPQVIVGKTLKGCVLQGCNLTNTRSHDIALDRYVKDLLETIKTLLKGAEGKGSGTVDELLAKMKNTGVQEVWDAVKGRCRGLEERVAFLENAEHDFSLRFDEQATQRGELGRSVESYAAHTEERFKKHKQLIDSVDNDTGESLNALEAQIEAVALNTAKAHTATNNRVARLEKNKGKGKRKGKQRPQEGCSVVLTKTLSLKPYTPTRLQGFGAPAMPWHNARGNWRTGTDPECYRVPVQGLYRAEFLGQAELCGGGSRYAEVLVVLPDQDGSPKRGLYYRGARVKDTAIETFVFTARTPVLHLPEGAQLYPQVVVRQGGECRLHQGHTWFSVTSV